jgi:phosphodiesterase/alkaline phosphatase D-like protein
MQVRTGVLAVILLALAAPAFAQEEPAPPHAAITHGPVIESVAPTSAVIAWTTNVSAGTIVRFGTDPNNLNNGTAMPWGGYTHRVTLRNLQPDTTYYFQAGSPGVQGTGETLSSPVGEIHTAAAQP